ncbi:MAG: molybdopterin-dependent oxidoreductase [Alphaproteobacteria bacterium]|nr:molybdopterin-dependent oxidoreductase [Alphaproteobacteria bacterium]MBU1552956.1 molybdopterin-dependent oxidoreductase [Alphaproteobacteria bacterium]MBU2338284.1 molybdopterin-dependent oxidoreductase [Alphaproteobacteria bacterium]MBU2388263.1 molybdopterin-dependent oxidoreductase [Alphaproteobacteria bacterium]
MAALANSLKDNPRLDRWLRFLDDRTVRIGTGKVELGQGVLTALAQIAAEELDLRIDQISMMSGNSIEGPAEGYTASSWSIEHSGSAIRLVAAEVRALACLQAALRLNASPEELTIVEGTFFRNGIASGLDYWAIAGELDLSREATGRISPKAAADYRLVGTSVARLDLPGKLLGSGFIQDMVLPAMLHARTLRQPGRGARLTALDEAAVRRRAGGDISIIRIGNFVALVGADETAVRAAAVAAAEYAVWSGARVLRPDSASAEWLAAQPSTDALIGDPPVEAQIDRLSYTFTRPFLSHGSLAPSCALALYRQGTLTVWSHAQGMHPLRDNIARTLGLPIENVACHHLQGAGCYGHNGADDAALDAALVAMALPDQPIRLMWRREEEFGYEPLSSAMTVTVHAALDAEGRPCDWTTEVWSATHGQRPGVGGAYLLAAEALKAPPPERMPFDIPLERGGGAVRNAVPLYDIAGKRISYHLIHDIPLRTSSLRGLGATLNVFAIEAMMDELADRAGQDPVAYRLSSLSDPRARATLERAAEMADWSSRGSGGAGSGRGIAIARYKNSSAYAAVVAAVAVDEAVRVTEVWCAVDAGLVINPDGVVNQIEGNIVQAISWALIEEVCLGSQGVTSVDWQSYPVIRFKDVPEIHVELIDARQHPALGVGECAGGPTAAAIGNAVADALGMRIHDMPMTRERIMAAVLQA